MMDPTMTEHGICPGGQFAIFIQVLNRGRNGCLNHGFFQYISLTTKYTISGGTLQYKVGLTLSFLSLISRGVGGIQNGNASILKLQYEVRGPPAHSQNERKS